jgi:hypothetical protein
MVPNTFDRKLFEDPAHAFCDVENCAKCMAEEATLWHTKINIGCTGPEEKAVHRWREVMEGRGGE